VKGAARTLHFRSLADAIHLAEDRYAAILRGNVPQREILFHEARMALAELASYREINRVKLNRSDDLSKITIDRDLVLNHFQVVRQWLQHEQPTVDELMVFLRQHSEALTNLIFEQLPTVFDAYIERASKIARDLGKAEPQLHIDVPAIPVTASARVVLDNCMIHILRNALDHGIESPEERKAQKKPPAGSIWIKGSVENQELVLEVYDDGKGLALGRLREKALENGSPAAQASDENLAALIFMDGMSTSPSLTPISGRGMGMSAVRRFLQEAGGTIDIVLRPVATDPLNYRSFFFIIRLPLEEPRQAAASEAA
jgi:chemotaxis protein histidine kinase CheA